MVCVLATVWSLRVHADPIQELLRRGWAEEDLDGVPRIIRGDVEQALRGPSIVRHYAGIRVRSDLVTENWLADHPPIAAAVGRELGVFPIILTESWPNTYKLEGGPLSRGTLTVLLRTDSRALVFASARVRSRWTGTVRAHVVACVRWWPADDGARVEHDIFIYGRLRSRTARWALALTRPLSGPLLTRRFHTLIDGARKTAEAVSADPQSWAQRMAERQDGGAADQLAWEELLVVAGAE